MKRTLLFIFLLLMQNALSQTQLSSHHLDLSKLERDHQAMAAVDAESNAIYVFASDKNYVTIQHYNSAFFFKDSLRADRPDKEYQNMFGHGFSESSPYIYWSSDDLRKFQAIHYNLESKTTASAFFEIPIKEELLTHFSKNGSFILVCQIPTQSKLKLYVFKGLAWQEQVLDLSGFTFSDASNISTFSNLIALHPIRKMSVLSGNSLAEATFVSKMFIETDKLILTLDHNAAQTQMLEIDLQNFTIRQKTFLQPQLQNPGKSNSYFKNGHVFQCVANKDEFVFQVQNYETEKIITTKRISANDSIAFKNSPLLSQTGNNEARTFRNTRKFLQRLHHSDIALAAHLMPDNSYLLSIGGTRYVNSPTAIVLGVTVFAAEVMAGSGGLADAFFDPDRLQVAFFDTVLDENFAHVAGETEPLAIDFISNFVREHRDISLNTTFKFRDYYVFGYYNANEKRYVMRKFEDGYADSNAPFFPK